MLTSDIELNHILTNDQVVDIFTKPLGKQKFLLFQEALSLCSLQQIKSQEKELKAQN
jgi:hypothetical protein